MKLQLSNLVPKISFGNSSQQFTPATPKKSGIPLTAASRYFSHGTYSDLARGDTIFRPLDNYTPFIQPSVEFKRMIDTFESDPELIFGLDFITSVSVGSGHYITAKNDALVEYFEQFCKDINLDYIATNGGRETLAYGNSVWQYLDLHKDPKSFDVIKQLPLSRLRRIWWDGVRPDSQIRFYEFHGFKQERFSPSELIHFRWRISDASPFGLGVIQPLVTQVQYRYSKNGEDELRTRMSIMDIKRSMQDFLHKSLRRHQRRVVYALDEAQANQAQMAQSQLDNLEDEQDFVIPGKVTTHELGAMARAIDTESFQQLYSNEIIKSLGTPTSRLYEKGSLTEASADAAKKVALMNLNGFQNQFKRMIERFIFKPWYQANPLKDANGVVIPWSATNVELNWGVAEKPEMTASDFGSIVSQLTPSPRKEEMIYKFLANSGVEVNAEEENANKAGNLDVKF